MPHPSRWAEEESPEVGSRKPTKGSPILTRRAGVSEAVREQKACALAKIKLSAFPDGRSPKRQGFAAMICSWLGVRGDQKTRIRVYGRQRKLRRKNVSTCVEAHRCAATAGGKRYFAEISDKPSTTAREGVINRQLQLLVASGTGHRHAVGQREVEVVVSRRHRKKVERVCQKQSLGTQWGRTQLIPQLEIR